MILIFFNSAYYFFFYISFELNNQINMKKLLSTKKLSRESLRQINGGNGSICCVFYCNTNECAHWTQPKVLCPVFPDCL